MVITQAPPLERMLGWMFKRSKRQVIRDNAAKGADGERRAKAKYGLMGYNVERTGHGSDYKISRRDWLTGKKETKLVEVKTGNAKLSPLQKKRKRSWGKRYVVERVDDPPFAQTASSTSSSGTKKGRKSGMSSLLGSPSGGTKKGRKSSSSSIWGSSSSGGWKRGKKSSSSSIWGSSSSGGSKRGKKSSSSSIWGSSGGRKRKRSVW